MPLIQIEQDSPDVIARARLEISYCVRRIHGYDTNTHVVILTFVSYCNALLAEQLISRDVFNQLIKELEHAAAESAKLGFT